MVLEHQFLTDMTDREEREIRFHHVFDSSIMMIQRCTVAVKDKTSTDGICLMNMPMGEKIFILGETVENRVIRFGLTSKDPKEIILPFERENLLNYVRMPCSCFVGRFNSYFSLNGNGVLECCNQLCDKHCYLSDCNVISFEGHKSHFLYFCDLSTTVPIWLVFLLPKEGGFVQISKQEITPSMKYVDFLNHDWY